MYDWNALFGEVEPEVVEVAEPESLEVKSDAENVVVENVIGEQLEEIDPDNMTPCSKCGSLELWQNPVRDWRCLGCDPPATAKRIKKTARRLREVHPPAGVDATHDDAKPSRA